jgi:hypothetical protein
MASIVSLRGTDCGCSGGFGADASSSPVITKPPMPLTTILIWAGVLGTTAYIFWGTLQPKKRRLVT